MLPVHCAAYRVSCPENLPDDTGEVDRVRARSQHSKIRAGMKTRSLLPRGKSPLNGPFVPSSIVDILHSDVSVVLDILHLLAVSMWFLESLDNHSSSRRTNSNLKKQHQLLNLNKKNGRMLGIGHMSKDLPQCKTRE